MLSIRKFVLVGLVAVGAASAFGSAASAQFYYESRPRYYEPEPRYYQPERRYAPQPRYYEPEQQYYRQPGYGQGGRYVDRDTALRNARALKEAQKRAIKGGYAVPGVGAPVGRGVPNFGQAGPSNDEIYRNRN